MLGLHLLNLRQRVPTGSHGADGKPQYEMDAIDGPWLAWSISFPATNKPNKTALYVVNGPWADGGIAREDEDDDDDDET